ncbi:MAG: ABC transporter permease, partial [Oscillospiraceae bacterium]
MKLWELMKFSFLNLWRRKLRTSLTVMGVMIGTASIVVMVSLGIGLNHATMEQIEKSSTLTLITVNNYGGGMMKANGGFQEEQKSVSITVDSVAEMAALEHVKSASPVYDFNVIAKSGKYEASFQIQAMSLNMLRSLNLPILKGSLPQEGDSLKLIAGQSIGSYFYDPKSNGAMMGGGMDSASKPPVDMFDSSIYIIYDSNAYYNSQSGDPQFKAPKKYLADVSTLLGMAQNGDEYNYSPFDYQVFADFEAVKTQFQHMFKKAAWPNQPVDKKGKPIIPMTFNMAYVLVDDVNNVLAVQEVLKGMGYQANSELEFVKSMQESSKLMQYVLAGIGGV